MSAQVECRSNHDYIGTPLAFVWQGMRLEVTEVITQNRNPASYVFKVRSGDGIFELEYDIHSDQ